jgi:hypothetical protein
MSYLFYCHILRIIIPNIKQTFYVLFLVLSKFDFVTASKIKQSIYVVSVLLSHFGSSWFLI